MSNSGFLVPQVNFITSNIGPNKNLVLCTKPTSRAADFYPVGVKEPERNWTLYGLSCVLHSLDFFNKVFTTSYMPKASRIFQNNTCFHVARRTAVKLTADTKRLPSTWTTSLFPTRFSGRLKPSNLMFSISHRFSSCQHQI